MHRNSSIAIWSYDDLATQIAHDYKTTGLLIVRLRLVGQSSLREYFMSLSELGYDLMNADPFLSNPQLLAYFGSRVNIMVTTDMNLSLVIPNVKTSLYDTIADASLQSDVKSILRYAGIIAPGRSSISRLGDI